MTPFTQPHSQSSLLTLYVYEDEGVDTFTIGMHTAAELELQLCNQPKVSQGQGHIRMSIKAQLIPAPL